MARAKSASNTGSKRARFEIAKSGLWALRAPFKTTWKKPREPGWALGLGGLRLTSPRRRRFAALESTLAETARPALRSQLKSQRFVKADPQHELSKAKDRGSALAARMALKTPRREINTFISLRNATPMLKGAKDNAFASSALTYGLWRREGTAQPGEGQT